MKIRTLIPAALWCLLVIPAHAFPPAPYYRIYGTVRNEQGRSLAGGEGTVILSGEYSVLNSATVSSGGGITGVTVLNGGSFTTTPDVTFIGANGTGNSAIGTANLSNGVVTSVTINSQGSGYVAPVIASFSGGGAAPLEIVRSVTSPSDGMNYSLSVPMDSGTVAQFDDLSAMRPWFPFTIRVVIAGQNYVPIQIAGAPSDFWKDRIDAVNLPETPGINVQGSHWAVGLPADKLRLDLTLGIDSDEDGLPDSWEQDIVDALGLGGIGEVDPNGDSDGDGVSNYIEYLAGTYAFDQSDRFELKIIEVTKTGDAPDETTIAKLQFLAISGRTYRIHEWTGSGPLIPREFFSDKAAAAAAAVTTGPPSSFLASDVTIQDVYLPATDVKGHLFILSVE
jgi:hypothetical protein